VNVNVSDTGKPLTGLSELNLVAVGLCQLQLCAVLKNEAGSKTNRHCSKENADNQGKQTI